MAGFGLAQMVVKTATTDMLFLQDVLKSQMKALLEEEADKIPIEEEIENQVMVILVLISFYIVSHLFKFILASYR
jgi:hypothetical protein